MAVEVHRPPGAAPGRHAHVTRRARCEHCAAAVELECQGLPGFWGYETFNEYHCPRCRKRNLVRSPGAVISARMAVDS
jgi:hypothetical protein